MRICANKIMFQTHAVVCDPKVADAEYMQLMAETLGAEADQATPREHARVLRNHNNDGSWGIERFA